MLFKRKCPSSSAAECKNELCTCITLHTEGEVTRSKTYFWVVKTSSICWSFQVTGHDSVTCWAQCLCRQLLWSKHQRVEQNHIQNTWGDLDSLFVQSKLFRPSGVEPFLVKISEPENLNLTGGLKSYKHKLSEHKDFWMTGGSDELSSHQPKWTISLARVQLWILFLLIAVNTAHCLGVIVSTETRSPRL